jgi:glutamine amidotransferase
VMQGGANSLPQGVDVVDLAAGNIGSVLRMLDRIGVVPHVLRDPSARAAQQSPLILPGVGNFAQVAGSKDWPRWRDILGDAQGRNVPILGICLGAQLMCLSSDEGAGRGLGWIDTVVRRFPARTVAGTLLRVPHMGWRQFSPPNGILPFEVQSGSMYFAHSYYVSPPAESESAPCQAEYGGIRFATVIKARNAIGVQFHPEKSHEFGRAFLTAWACWAGGLQ